MSDQYETDNLLAYQRRYETHLNRLLRHRRGDYGRVYCLGLWLDSALKPQLQNAFRQKRAALYLATHLLSVGLFAFALAFYFAFDWYFFP